MNVFKLVADLRMTFNYSYNEIMYEIPFANLLLQLHSYYKSLEQKYEKKGNKNKVSDLANL